MILYARCWTTDPHVELPVQTSTDGVQYDNIRYDDSGRIIAMITCDV